MEMVQELSEHLQQTDHIIQRYLVRKGPPTIHHAMGPVSDSTSSMEHESTASRENNANEKEMAARQQQHHKDKDYIGTLQDADDHILQAFHVAPIEMDNERDSSESLETLSPTVSDDNISISKGPTKDKRTRGETTFSSDELAQAYRSLRTVREYLPQMVSAVLKSPPAFDAHISNPLARLRKLLLQRCQQDPSWGIELCWLLEAEVGRTWKTLFEHRQQTGRRLIVVLPAEKAAVLAKIGTEKREAFDLLQDAEQSTAFGYTVDPPTEVTGQYRPPEMGHEFGYSPPSSRLPSSIGLLRCSHFGDAMHFIDRLSKVSSDLRRVPISHRKVRNSCSRLNTTFVELSFVY